MTNLVWHLTVLVQVFFFHFMYYYLYYNECAQFTIVKFNMFSVLRNDARRVQVGLRAQCPSRGQDVARLGGGQEEIGRGNIEHLLRRARRPEVSERMSNAILHSPTDVTCAIMN